MNETFNNKNNQMQSGDIIKMLDDFQNTLDECQRNCQKMINSDDTTRPDVQAYVQNNWAVPNHFQQMNSDQQKHYIPSDGMGKTTNQYIEKGGYASGSGNGYSTEEDGIISLNTDWCGRSRNNDQQPTSDSDNNSMVVEFSDDESCIQELPTKPFNNNVSQGMIDRSGVKDPNRHTHKRVRLSDLQEMNTALNSPSVNHQRRASKTKLQYHQDQSSDSESASNNYSQQHRTFIQNQSRAHSIKTPRLSYPTSQPVAAAPEQDHNQRHLGIPISYPAMNSNQQILYKFVHPSQLQMYNTIPLLPAVRPSIWPVVAPIYIPTNQPVFLALGQPHQYLQQPSTSSAQMATYNPSPMSDTSIARENLIGKSDPSTSNPSPTVNQQTTSGSNTNRPELSWLRKELINPPTQTGPDGQPIKIKTRRPPLPDWVKAAVENCHMGQANHVTANMISKERLYRKIVEETYEYQRLQENAGN